MDLSDDIVTDQMQLVAWQGDIPNFFYKLEIPEDLSQYFCLEGVTARELFSSLGIEAPPGTVGNKLAIKVVSMGWSWAPFLAQVAAEDVLSSVPEIISDRENNLYEEDDVSSDIGIDEDVPVKRDYRLLKHMQVTPQFFDENGEPAPFRLGVSYVYIDDFGGWAVLPKVDDANLSFRDAYPEAEKDLSAARSRLTKAGLGCHKEVLGLPNALGYEVVQKQRFLPNVTAKHVSSQEPFRIMNHYMLKGNDDKLFPIIAFCIFTLQRNSVSPQHLAQMLGGWTWFLLFNRPLLSIFDDVYSFQNIYWNDRFSEIELWPSVRCELHCVFSPIC